MMMFDDVCLSQIQIHVYIYSVAHMSAHVIPARCIECMRCDDPPLLYDLFDMEEYF